MICLARSHRARALVSLLSALLICLGLVGPVAAWAPNTYSASSEAALLTLTNADRGADGLTSLPVDPVLAVVARWRSADMIKRNYFSHNIPVPPGGVVFDELNRRHYCYTMAGENIGWNTVEGSGATAAIETAFLGSTEHRTNILNPAWTSIGIGAYRAANGRQMWAVLFAKACPPGTTTFPAPTARPSHNPVIPTMSPLPSPPADQSPSANPSPSPSVSPSATDTSPASPAASASQEPAASPSPDATESPPTSPSPDSGGSGGGPSPLLFLILAIAGIAGAIYTVRGR
jgi:hypothetical protein